MSNPYGTWIPGHRPTAEQGWRVTSEAHEIFRGVDLLNWGLSQEHSPATGCHKAITQLLADVAAAAIKDLIISEWDPATGSAIIGQGVRWLVKLPDSAGNQDIIGALDWRAKGVISGSEAYALDLRVMRAGTLTLLRSVVDRWGLGGWDYVVDPTDGDFTILQGADDDAGSAAYTMFVKAGTYAAGLTVASNNAHLFIEPGTTIQAGITLSGNNITLVLGAGCDVQGVITISGTGCTLKCYNGCDIDGISLSGTYIHVDGGGWETISDGGTTVHGLHLNGCTNCTAENLTCKTTPAGGGTKHAIALASGTADVLLRNINITGSDDAGISSLTGDTDRIRIESCKIRACDSYSILASPGGAGNTLEWTIISCDIAGAGAAIEVALDQADHARVQDSHIAGGSNRTCIDISSNCTDTVITGNRLSDFSGTGVAIADAGTSTTNSGNDTTA